MMYLYAPEGGRLQEQQADESLPAAIWIDLYRPVPGQIRAVEELGVTIPALSDMEEIEISNRLYHEADHEYMTVLLSGLTPEKEQATMPVTFILGADRLVTVRHHVPRPFETYAGRADKGTTGCSSAAHVYLGLVEEVLGRQADLLEGVGRNLDRSARAIFSQGSTQQPSVLQDALVTIGGQGEVLSRVRLGLMTLERMLAYYSQTIGDHPGQRSLRLHCKARLRDVQALEVHADFLSARLSQTTDATLGMVNLAQNMTVRIVSVVAVLFVPPTLIASVYGMNFQQMPELAQPWGYPLSLVVMACSAIATYLFFRWKNWL